MRMPNLSGYTVRITPDTPRVQLSEKVTVSQQFRDQINAWLAEFFGVTNILSDGVVMRTENILFMNPRTHKWVQEAMK